jgi:hypothetical protein
LICRHLRTFLITHDEEGKPLYFHFFDPRVLRVYLPTCNAEEVSKVFGPVISYSLEGEESNTALRFRIVSNSLRQAQAQFL